MVHCTWEQLVQVVLMTKTPPQRWQCTAWLLVGIGAAETLSMAYVEDGESWLQSAMTRIATTDARDGDRIYTDTGGRGDGII